MSFSFLFNCGDVVVLYNALFYMRFIRFYVKTSAYDMESYFTLCPKPELLYREEFLKTPVSSTNKTDRHDIAEILLKVALKHHKPSKPNQI